MSDPPAVGDLEEAADRALRHAEGDAQATAAWRDGRVTVEVTCVIDGRAARAVAEGVEDGALRRAARAAALHARRPRAWPSAGLPDPVGGVPGPLPCAGTLVRVAIASSRGVRAAWERRPAGPEPAAGAATPPAGDPAGMPAGDPAGMPAGDPAGMPVGDSVDMPVGDPAGMPVGDSVDMPRGDLPIVFGHAAVATVLDHLRPAFGVELDLASGPLHGRLGQRVAATAVHLAALACGYDAEGIPRTHVVLVEAGVATGRVHDTASAARAHGRSTTGHATRAAALAPLPEHLHLSPGEADAVEALWADVDRGLYVPALSAQREADGDAFVHHTQRAVLIEAGRPAAPVRAARMRIDPLEILAGVEALTAGTRTLPLAGEGSADVPALRARASAGRSC